MKLLTTNYKLQTKKSFTLIELLLYIAIISIMLTTLILFAWNIMSSGIKSTTSQEVGSTARYLSERIKLEIRNAEDINFANSDFDINLATNPGRRLTLIASPPNNPTVIDVGTGRARISQGGNPAIPLNSNDTVISDLTFTNYSSADNRTKHIGFILTVNSAYTGERQEYKDTITIRSSGEVRSN